MQAIAGLWQCEAPRLEHSETTSPWRSSAGMGSSEGGDGDASSPGATRAGRSTELANGIFISGFVSQEVLRQRPPRARQAYTKVLIEPGVLACGPGASHFILPSLEHLLFSPSHGLQKAQPMFFHCIPSPPVCLAPSGYHECGSGPVSDVWL